MKAVVAAFNQEKALVGAFSVITNLRMDLFEAHHHLTFLGEKSQRLVRAAFISSLKAPLGVSQPAEARLARQSRGRGSRRLGVTMVRVGEVTTQGPWQQQML